VRKHRGSSKEPQNTVCVVVFAQTRDIGFEGRKSFNSGDNTFSTFKRTSDCSTGAALDERLSTWRRFAGADELLILIHRVGVGLCAIMHLCEKVLLFVE